MNLQIQFKKASRMCVHLFTGQFQKKGKKDCTGKITAFWEATI